ncbi:unnamed protein product [Psylliodes chrysocephalus]|uniref:Regulatory protein zeste n=1 Tax=Psylliodes chrysocephalus TaxID=3402493 RepID=A0A9P0GDA3_9CUCU|nr:unnamed protein product [Psylliodes chrysocephala]
MDVKRLQKTKKQYEELLTFVQRNKVIAGTFKGNPSDYTKIYKLWEEFAKHINSLGYGPTKTAKQWRHVFTEWKQNIRRKSRDIKKEQIGTGGGPSKTKSLTDLEERLLSLIGLVHLGHNEVLDSMGKSEVPLIENEQEVSTYNVETSLVDELELENVSTLLLEHNYQIQDTIIPQQNEENDDQEMNTEPSNKETADKQKLKRNSKKQNRQILHEATKMPKKYH